MGKNRNQNDLEIARRLGKRIQDLRSSRDWTQAELARRIESHRPLVARAERGTHVLSVGVLLRYANAFDLAPSEFLECLDGAAGTRLREPIV